MSETKRFSEPNTGLRNLGRFNSLKRSDLFTLGLQSCNYVVLFPRLRTMHLRQAAIDEANKLASDLLYWQGSSLHMGHYRKDMLPDYLKFQPIPDHLGNLTDEELTEELGVVMDDPHPLNERLVLTPGWHTFIPSGVPGYYQPDKHEKKPVKAMKTIQDRTDHNAAPVVSDAAERTICMPDVPCMSGMVAGWGGRAGAERFVGGCRRRRRRTGCMSCLMRMRRPWMPTSTCFGRLSSRSRRKARRRPS